MALGVAWLLASLAGCAWAMVSAATPSALAELIQSALERAGKTADADALARAPLPKGESGPSIAAPAAFRADPLLALTSLDEMAAAVGRAGDSPSEALAQSARWAYGSARWPPNGQRADPVLEDSARSWALPGDGIRTGLERDLQDFLQTVAQADAWRRQALARWPPEVSAPDLWRKFVPLGPNAPGEARDIPGTSELLALVEQPSLAQGLLVLVQGVDTLRRRLAARPPPPSSLRLETPWGEVWVQSGQECNVYRGRQPMLLIDTGGNDTYAFDEKRAAGIAALLDMVGDDHYLAHAPGQDPSAATLGYAVLWDQGGDDVHEAGWLAQGAALFGASALIDNAGDDSYSAIGAAQGFALGGVTLLVDHEGNDSYRALTQAQASAGPDALAIHIDSSGDDHYLLDKPLIAPSAQLPDRNASLGQGCAFGLRVPGAGAVGTDAGGAAVLVDRGGNDRYVAEVFAQGAGYGGAMGALLDGGGDDAMEAAWYAMGAAAHQATGLLVARGNGRDSYAASHTMALGAAHDDSIAVFMGGSGNDNYRVASLGLGAAHDGSTAVFIDTAGDDDYDHTLRPCQGFGSTTRDTVTAAHDEEAPARVLGTAVFADLSGRNSYRPGCPATAPDATSPTVLHSGGT